MQASFLIPIINIILADPELIVAGDHIQPQCIIVTPTRELTIQIYNEARKFSHRSVLKVCVAYGGTGVRHQADRIMVRNSTILSLFLHMYILFS